MSMAHACSLDAYKYAYLSQFKYLSYFSAPEFFKETRGLCLQFGVILMTNQIMMPLLVYRMFGETCSKHLL